MSKVSITAATAFPFMVTRKGRTLRPGQTLPRARYQTLDQAAEEAEAQASANPGTTILVFQEVLRAKACDQDPAASPAAAGGAGRQCPPSSGSKRKGS